MEIVWDEPKRLKNITTHDGLDFKSLTVEFFEAASIFPAKENRYSAVGMLNGVVLSVVFKPLGSEAVSIISMRPASRKERKAR